MFEKFSRQTRKDVRLLIGTLLGPSTTLLLVGYFVPEFWGDWLLGVAGFIAGVVIGIIHDSK